MGCPSDCGACPIVCGDHFCDNAESCTTCPQDCGACPPMCGNGSCEAGETCSTCPQDCGACPVVCGNGMCQAGETCTNCPQDCGACVCDVCVTGAALDPTCSICASIVCSFDDYCCTTLWDSVCVDEASVFCGICP